jgi:hypothetical protein
MLHCDARSPYSCGLGKLLVCLAVFNGAAACSHEGAGPPASSPETAAPTGAAGSTPTTSAGAAPSSTASAEPQSQYGASVFVVHMLSDFDAFKKYLEEGAAERDKVGIKGYLLSRLDDGKVVIHFVADDLDAVQKALDSPELERYAGRKGASDTSVVWLTKNVILRTPETPPAGQTFSLFLRLHVGDFAALQRGFEQRHAVFAEQGVIGEGLHRSPEGDVAILHFVGTARDKLEALTRRPEFIELLKQAGTKGEVKPLIGVDLMRSRPK